ncbi:MAG: Spy/CpxP family protein refolding chaperone [Acidobacteriota bacterium]|nr:Spy/CpxP family protein refolding chaperone [Acidobacteriota bacterium]
MKNIVTRAGLTLGLIAGLSATNAFAQQAPATQGGTGDAGDNTQQTERMGKRRGEGRHMRGGRRGGGGMGFLKKLNLTEAQQQQVRAIEEEYALSTKPQRDEMHQLFQVRRQGGTLTTEQETRARELRQQFGESAKAMRERVTAILTPEQRAEAERMMQERRSRRGEGRERPMNRPNIDNQ